jgi:hypothetical protein
MLPEFKDYINSFEKRLATIDISTLNIEAYPKTYLQLLLDNCLYYLHIYADVFSKALKHSTKTKEQIVLVDYGAGNGLLGMFAKHCGFRKVYLADVSEIFIDAAIQLSDELEINVDGFVVGDCNILAEYCTHEEVPDVIVGTDVIEHIYNLDEFFACVKQINKNVVSVFTTASVTANPVKAKKLKQLQHRDEFLGSDASHAMPGQLFAGVNFVEIRRYLIKKNFHFFDNQVIDQLALATRGLNEPDIIKACREYFHHKHMPQPAHPTNTCDPITGSWTERLLTVKEYLSIYKKVGFGLRVYNGFYNEWQGGKKGITLKLLNKTTHLLGEQGMFLSSYIILVGK